MKKFAAIRSHFLRQSCASCHSNESGISLATLTTYAEGAKLADVDLGTSIQALARVSDVHLFGVSHLYADRRGLFIERHTSLVSHDAHRDTVRCDLAHRLLVVYQMGAAVLPLPSSAAGY